MPSHSKIIQNYYLRQIVFFCGHISVLLGFVGVFLPVMPTAPFMILAAICYLRSSPKFYQWLVAHPQFGSYIIAYLDGKGIPKKAKIIGILMMWTGILFSIVIILDSITLRIFLPIVALLVTIYLWRLPNWSPETK